LENNKPSAEECAVLDGVEIEILPVSGRAGYALKPAPDKETYKIMFGPM